MTLRETIGREKNRQDYRPCGCQETCVRQVNHTGTCASDFEGNNGTTYYLSFSCRDRNDYPHDEEEPKSPWLGPNKPSVPRRAPAKAVGDYIRTRAQLSRRSLQRLATEHPEVPIPEALRQKFLK